MLPEATVSSLTFLYMDKGSGACVKKLHQNSQKGTHVHFPLPFEGTCTRTTWVFWIVQKVFTEMPSVLNF